jgi:bleomycin hydrolase
MLCIIPSLTARSDQRRSEKDKVKYQKYQKDQLLKTMKDDLEKKEAAEDKVTKKINEKYEEIDKKKKDERRIIKYMPDGIKFPTSISDFKSAFHFPPTHQDYTGNCWCFSTISFFESEVYRSTKQKIKLSELYIVYWEFVEKAIGYVEKRGNQVFGEGSESDAVVKIMKKYGIVPKLVWDGHRPDNFVYRKEPRYDQRQMFKEMKTYLETVKSNNMWYKDLIIDHIKVILNSHLGGHPPTNFKYNGTSYTPITFLNKVLKLNMNDYYALTSTMKQPFWKQVKFDVPDNWRPTKHYINVPLNVFYNAIKACTKKGYSLCIGGDVSEPGYNGKYDIATVPTYDIPQGYIDQHSRELRIENKTTQDDHGIHIVGYMKIDGRDWYLIKDSARSSRKGKFRGYYFYRDDYVKLKMLSIMLHKDTIKNILSKAK